MFSMIEDETSELCPRNYYQRIIKAYPEHEHLARYEPAVGFIIRQEPKIKAGRAILGTCFMPRVNGELSGLFDWSLGKTFGFFPDFLVMLDGHFWFNVSDREREIRMFHEMMHMAIAVDQYGALKFNRLTGDPVWALIGHDIEEFNAVVARYGEWTPEIRSFLEAARESRNGA